MLELRPYQKRAVQKMLWSMSLEGASLLSYPQGVGKSVIIAAFAHQLNQPVLILTPSKELLEQDMDKLKHYVPESEIGVFSASMRSKTVNTFTFATIQSAYKHPSLFSGFDVAIIDECHQLNVANKDGMYNKLFAGMGQLKVIGLTATPFRMDHYYERTGGGKYDITTVHCTRMINRYQERFWKHLIAVEHIEDMMEQGYLSPLTYQDLTLVDQDNIPINKSASDFDLIAYEELISDKEERIAETIMSMQSLHKSVLVFASSIDQASRLSIATGAEVVFGKSKPKERERVIGGFKDGSIKTVVNVGVLNTGFDHPELDCIILARPTRSLSLLMQMCGRGTRIALDKTSCEIVDMAGNISFLGRAETMRVEKNEGLWDVSTNRGFWHKRELYKYQLKHRTSDIDDTQGYSLPF